MNRLAKLNDALRLYEQARKTQAQAKAIIAELGSYDGGAHGAAGEVYAEEVLGMVKARASERDVDGWIDGIPVQVKAKTVEGLKHFRSRYIELDAECEAEEVVVILIFGVKLVHFGNFKISDLRGTPTRRLGKPTGKVRYPLKDMPAPAPDFSAEGQ